MGETATLSLSLQCRSTPRLLGLLLPVLLSLFSLLYTTHTLKERSYTHTRHTHTRSCVLLLIMGAHLSLPALSHNIFHAFHLPRTRARWFTQPSRGGSERRQKRGPVGPLGREEYSFYTDVGCFGSFVINPSLYCTSADVLLVLHTLT